jgi:hypothetical protein
MNSDRNMPHAPFVHYKPPWIVMELNSGLCDEKSVFKRVSNGTVSMASILA